MAEERRSGHERRTGRVDVTSLATGVDELTGEVRLLRKDVRMGKIIVAVLSVLTVIVVVLGTLGYLAYSSDKRQDKEDRYAGRAALCGILNDYVIARDEAGVRAILLASARSPEQMANENKGKTKQEIEDEAADQARRLLIYVEGQDMKLVDGLPFAPRIDCEAYVRNPGIVVFLPVPKPKPTTTTTASTTSSTTPGG